MDCEQSEQTDQSQVLFYNDVSDGIEDKSKNANLIKSIKIQLLHKQESNKRQ